jgi:hypothetical protein
VPETGAAAGLHFVASLQLPVAAAPVQTEVCANTVLLDRSARSTAAAEERRRTEDCGVDMEVNKGTVVNVIENDYDMASAKIFLHENGLVHGGPKNIVAAGLRSLASYMPMPRPSTQPSAPSERPPGIKQLAAELGVSVGTVSRAMNNRYGVDPETRERVMEAAKRLGYVPDAAARRLKSHPLWRVTVLFAPFLGPNREINPAALATVEALRQ